MSSEQAECYSGVLPKRDSKLSFGWLGEDRQGPIREVGWLQGCLEMQAERNSGAYPLSSSPFVHTCRAPRQLVCFCLSFTVCSLTQPPKAGEPTGASGVGPHALSLFRVAALLAMVLRLPTLGTRCLLERHQLQMRVVWLGMGWRGRCWPPMGGLGG